ncbi:MAG: hypothetical protein AABY44_09405 [Nitrospirota bacterium]
MADSALPIAIGKVAQIICVQNKIAQEIPVHLLITVMVRIVIGTYADQQIPAVDRVALLTVDVKEAMYVMARVVAQKDMVIVHSNRGVKMMCVNQA